MTIYPPGEKMQTRALNVTDVLGLGKVAHYLWLPALLMVIGYLNGCP